MDDSSQPTSEKTSNFPDEISRALDSDAGKAAVAKAIAEATSGLKAKRDELLESNRKLKDEISARQEDSVKTTARLSRADATIRKLLVDNGLTEALGKAKVAPEFIEAARALIKTREEVSIGEQEGKAVAMIGEATLEAFVTRWAESDEGRPFLSPLANSGGGPVVSVAGRPNAKNPWSRPDRNLAEQARIVRENPELAARLKAQAQG